MMIEQGDRHPWPQAIHPAERTRLVRFCTRRVGVADVAEDLARETLIEAWRHAGRLADPDARGRWLFGIARNVCRRWQRANGRDAAHRAPVLPGADAIGRDLDDLSGDRDDPVLGLEREELVEVPLPWRNDDGVHFRCPCHEIAFDAGLSALTLWLPEGRRFWQKYPRLRKLPAQEVEAFGRPAIVSRFESLTDSAHFDVVSTRDTFELLGVYGAPSA